ncbi:carcinoembryonic antigen-related cell adhesion molecule 5-like isoform X1 [Ictalurus furcatus]|uniref:carcinoembryonic antigen-related cell adhesion molecule 5-like isoform X1 n=1 Tax=Ictalurus furcatus TaxID=66913 RepID=UPI00234FCF1A|nr:carcinoembryonic antigen-related cell adhesion molecule 5-like isoform X1 [Ictalurus furcatus]
MELRPLRVMILLISLIRVGQAQVIKPVLSVEPNSPQIFRGETVTLTCRISGWSGPYYWTKDGVNVHRSDENYYTINVDHSHKYRCYGSVDGRTTAWSNEVTLSVIERPKAVLTLQPDGPIFSGQEVTFTCEIRGHADTEWIYNWYKDGVQISSYTESRKYSFTPVESLSAKYTCSGRRRSDSQTSETSNTVTLTVSEKPKPTVRVNPQSSVYTGDRVTLNCNLLSNGWTFLWYKDRVQVAEDTNTLHDTVSNAGETVYQCKARRENYDSELSDPVTVTVRALPKPVVSINPDEQVYRGETVTLRCDIQDEEDSDWIYSWNKDGSGVSSEQEYRISSAETSHAGKYTCRGRERGGSHSSHTSDAVTLTVSGSGSSIDIVFVSVGLSLALLFIILLLILRWWHKSNKGKDRDIQQNSNQTPGQNPSQSGAEDSQSGHTPLQTDVHIYATVENASKSDSAAEPSGDIYTKVMKKKEPHNNKNDVAGPSDVTYTELELKPQKKTKKNQVKASVEYGTVYSQLKQST